MNLKIIYQVIVLTCFIILGTLISVKLADEGEQLSGAFRTVDGDSLAIAGRRLRLAGIDAPELDQTCLRHSRDWACGQASRAALAAYIGRRDAVCRGRKLDKYGRLLVTCRSGKITVNAALVREGAALAYGDYRAEQQAAEAERAGLWSSEFDLPSDWRRRHSGLEEDEGLHRPSMLGAFFDFWEDEQ